MQRMQLSKVPKNDLPRHNNKTKFTHPIHMEHTVYINDQLLRLEFYFISVLSLGQDIIILFNYMLCYYFSLDYNNNQATILTIKICKCMHNQCHVIQFQQNTKLWQNLEVKIHHKNFSVYVLKYEYQMLIIFFHTKKRHKSGFYIHISVYKIFFTRM